MDDFLQKLKKLVRIVLYGPASMFMSENICTIVDLFDKVVAEGVSNHCGNEVRRWWRDRNIDKIET